MHFRATLNLASFRHGKVPVNFISINNGCVGEKKLTDWGFEKYIDLLKGKDSVIIKMHRLFKQRVLFNIDEIWLFFHNNILAILRPTMFLLENVINCVI